ncbi:MAG: GxxExxY protein [Ignavibacteriales bacterium]|nr:GxxExxY protein [Ignavibacteriales bacterium]
MIIYKEESNALIRACREIDDEMGCGFQEYVYRECLAIEFTLQSIAFECDRLITFRYGDDIRKKEDVTGFVCFGKILLEIRAVSALTDSHRSQAIIDLHAAGFELGLLVNFGTYPRLEYERYLLNTAKRYCRDSSSPPDEKSPRKVSPGN